MLEAMVPGVSVTAKMMAMPEVLAVPEMMAMPEVLTVPEMMAVMVPKVMPVTMAEMVAVPETGIMAEVMTEMQSQLVPVVTEVRAEAGVMAAGVQNNDPAVRLSEAGCEKQQRDGKQKGRNKTARIHINLRRCDLTQLETCTARMEFRGAHHFLLR
jgi:hypothetical protein